MQVVDPTDPRAQGQPSNRTVVPYIFVYFRGHIKVDYLHLLDKNHDSFRLGLWLYLHLNQSSLLCPFSVFPSSFLFFLFFSVLIYSLYSFALETNNFIARTNPIDKSQCFHGKEGKFLDLFPSDALPKLLYIVNVIPKRLSYHDQNGLYHRIRVSYYE